MEKIAEVIKYEGDNSIFIWKHPCEDFNSLTQLIVHESQEAVFFMNGQALDLFGAAQPSLLFHLMGRLAAGLMSCNLSKMLSEKSMSARRRIHPLFISLVPQFMQYRQVFEDKNALLWIDAPPSAPEIPLEPVIWCANHGFKDDVAATLCAARHAYILFGSLPAFFNTLDGLCAYLNGVVMCNRKMKESKKASVDGAAQVIRMGTDVVVFPEGVWNKTPEKLRLPLWPGAYRLAKETGCKIVPVIHYLADPHEKRKGNVIHTVIADPISMDGLSEAEGTELLRDTMATWYYRLMEKYGSSTREKLLSGFDTADEAWENYISIHTGCVKYYDREIELCADCRPRDIVRPEEVWASIANIQNTTAANAGHVQYARQLVATEHCRDFQHRF